MRAHRLRVVVGLEDRPPKARPVGVDRWVRFEAGKAEIERTARSAAEYEARLRALTKELGL